MSGKVLNVTDDDFEAQVLKSDQPVLVDFWAEWCAPCKTLGPIIEEIANEHGNVYKVVKVNVDDSPESMRTYHIRGIPTVLVFADGEVKNTLVGVRSKSDYVQSLEAVKAA